MRNETSFEKNEGGFVVKRNKWLAMLLTIAMVVMLVPTTVLAASPTTLNVNGTSILTATDNKVACGNGTAEYDPESNTLTLTDVTIEGDFSGHAAIFTNGDLTIRLIGTNTITSGWYGIYSSNNNSTITIGGSGTLTINADNDCVRGADLIIGIAGETDAPIVNVTGKENYASGIYATNTLTIQNGANVTAISEAQGFALCGENGVVITGSTVNTTVDGIETNVIASWADFSIDSSTVTATGTSEYAYPAIYAAGDINVTNESNVEAISSGMRGIFTENDMTVTDSIVTATGMTAEGMVVVGTLNLTNSKLTASSKPNDIIPAIVTKNFNITNSEVTANGGFDLMDWNEGNTDGISLSITPADGKLAEFKVDGNNWDGSAAVHFKEGSKSPYDTAVNFSADEMNWLGAYRYIHIGEHNHIGGTATCETPAICEDCDRPYGNALGHNAVKTEAKAATCTEDGNIEYWYCNACGKYFSDEALTQPITKDETVVKAAGHGETELKNAKEATCTAEGYTGDKVCKVCGEVVEQGKAVPKVAHSYKDGKCTVCGAADPNYKPTEPTESGDGDTDSPQTGDNSNVALWVTMLFASGGVFSLVTYRKKKRLN